MSKQILFYNGKWYPVNAKPVFLDLEYFAFQHAFHYASAAFEGTRCYPNLAKNDGTVNLIGVDLRVDRLFRSMEYAWIKLPPSPAPLWENFASAFPKLAQKYKTVLKEKIEREAILSFSYSKAQVREFILKTLLINLGSGYLNPKEGCYVRPIALRGINATKSLGVFSLGHRADFLVAVKPWGKYLGKEAFEKGAPVVVAPEGNEEMNRQHKLASNYLTGQRLVDLASFNRFNEVLITDRSPQRNVLEGSGENLLFYVGGNQFISPAQPGKAILPGTTLKTVDQMIRLMGGEVIYRDISLREVMDGKFLGAALTGTAAEITPVSLVYDPQTKRAVEIPVADEIKTLQKNYLQLAQGLPVETALKKLQQELIWELKWNEKEHAQLVGLIEKS